MANRRYAQGTDVLPEQSRVEIERTLRRYGADAIMTGYDDDRLLVRWRMRGRHLQRIIEVPSLADKQFDRAWDQRERRRLRERETGRLWRVMLLWLKSTLEMVESGTEAFEIAFLPYTVLPDGQTVGEFLAPQIAAAYQSGQMPTALLPAPRERA